MKNLKKISTAIHIVAIVAIVAWVASLAARNYISWGLDGFVGYAAALSAVVAVPFGLTRKTFE